MSFATDMLTKVQTAYANALDAHMQRYGDQLVQRQELDKLLAQVNYWQAQVDAETARASGKNIRAPIQVVL